MQTMLAHEHDFHREQDTELRAACAVGTPIQGTPATRMARVQQRWRGRGPASRTLSVKVDFGRDPVGALPPG